MIIKDKLNNNKQSINMEEYYMSLIYEVFGLKENENLTVKEQQDKIVQILSSMKMEVIGDTKRQFKKECIKSLENSLNNL